MTSPKMRPISLSPAIAIACISSAESIGMPSKVFSAQLPLACSTSFFLTVCLHMPNLLGSHIPAWSWTLPSRCFCRHDWYVCLVASIDPTYAVHTPNSSMASLVMEVSSSAPMMSVTSAVSRPASLTATRRSASLS